VIHYFDTSFLVPLIVPEPASEPVERVVAALPAEATLVWSHWGHLEFASVIARLVRMGELAEPDAGRCLQELAALVAQSFRMHLPTPEDFEVAQTLMTSFDSGLRPGDALHLGIARNLRAARILTLDAGLHRAGSRFDLPMQGLE
jgi:uncharacterized protein